MKWFSRHPIVKWGALATLLFVILLLVLRLQPDALARYKNQLAASGEELSLVKLAPPQTQEAIEFYKQFSAIAEGIAAAPIHGGELQLMGKPTNGFSTPLWLKPEPLIPGKGSWADLDAQMKQSEAAFTQMHQLLAMPPVGSIYNPNNPVSTPSGGNILIQKRRAAQGLSAAVVNDLHQGELPSALTNLHTLLALTRLRDEGGMLVDFMIHVAIGGLAISSTWEALQAPGWSEPRLIALQTELASLGFAPRIPRVIQLERNSTLACLAISQTKYSGRMSLMERAYYAIYFPLLSKADELRYLQNLQPFLEDTRRAAANTNHTAMRSALTNAIIRAHAFQSKLNQLRFPLASMTTLNWEKACLHTLKYETRRQMAIAALALKRHQLRHGKLPDTLATLVPEYLPAPPTDFLGNHALIYERLSDTQFTLRSLGENGSDDHGETDDLLWPAARPNSPDTSPLP